MLNNFWDFCYHLLTFTLQEHYQSVKWSVSRSERRSVGTELEPNYLQMLSADKERVDNENKSGLIQMKDKTT